jgi:glycosyltransferase involved in cell wall biosynthesis
MKEDLLFSIIIPTYNREKLITRAIESVLNQSYKNYEIIVVDDGSIDNTEILLEKYINKNLVTYLKNEKNQGQNFSLNRGIDFSNGDVLCFLDSDDYWQEDFLKQHFLVYTNNKYINVVYSEALLDSNKNICKKFSLSGFVYKEVLEQGYLSHMITITARKNTIISIGCFDINFIVNQDDDFCFRLSKNNEVYLIKKPLAVICEDANNRTIRNYLNAALGWAKLIDKYKDDIVLYCGYKQLKKHYFLAAKKFIYAGNFRMYNFYMKNIFKFSFIYSPLIYILYRLNFKLKSFEKTN